MKLPKKEPYTNVWDFVFTFGKYKNDSFKRIWKIDQEYIYWANINTDKISLPKIGEHGIKNLEWKEYHIDLAIEQGRWEFDNREKKTEEKEFFPIWENINYETEWMLTHGVHSKYNLIQKWRKASPYINLPSVGNPPEIKGLDGLVNEFNIAFYHRRWDLSQKKKAEPKQEFCTYGRIWDNPSRRLQWDIERKEWGFSPLKLCGLIDDWRKKGSSLPKINGPEGIKNEEQLTTVIDRAFEHKKWDFTNLETIEEKPKKKEKKQKKIDPLADLSWIDEYWNAA